MIRRFFLFLTFTGLAALTVEEFVTIQHLKAENQALTTNNETLQVDLMNEAHGHKIKFLAKVRSNAFDPTADAQIHLTKAETAMAKGNIGDALAECKTAAADVQMASSSTSASVRNSVGDLANKLDGIEQQAEYLWKKLGA